jgi:hypothetical protein
VLATPAMKDRFARLGVDPLALDPAAFAQMIEREFLLNGRIAKAAGVKGN